MDRRHPSCWLALWPLLACAAGGDGAGAAGRSMHAASSGAPALSTHALAHDEALQYATDFDFIQIGRAHV